MFEAGSPEAEWIETLLWAAQTHGATTCRAVYSEEKRTMTLFVSNLDDSGRALLSYRIRHVRFISNPDASWRLSDRVRHSRLPFLETRVDSFFVREDWTPMLEDPAMVAVVREAQAAGATFCRAKFAAGGRIRVYVDLFGIRKARLEEKLRWVLPEYFEPMCLFGDQP